MSRACHLVAYDIRDPKRLREVAKTMVGFGIRMQYSVFVCDLTPAERLELFDALLEIVDTRVDCVAAVEFGEPGDGRPFMFIGPRPGLLPAGPVIL